MSARLVDILLDLCAALEAAEVPYAVCGGLAMAVHGFERATWDIDLLIMAQDHPAAEIVAQSQGFQFPALPMTLAEGAVRIHCLSRLLPEDDDALPLNLILVSDALRDDFARRERVRIGSRALWVLGRDGMRRMKRLRDSPKDRIDLDALDELDRTDAQDGQVPEGREGGAR